MSTGRGYLPRAFAAAHGLGLTAALLAGCGGTSDNVEVSIGYQSKTINTVTAGTLMRELGYFEKNLDALETKTGKHYVVSWHDFPSGPPVTAEMIARKIDIGSMGDYPLAVNGARTAADPNVRTRWVSVTGYNPTGSLNQVVVPTASDATSLADLEGKVISTSLGSTAHGNLVRALRESGLSSTDARLLNQDPPVGVTALEAGQVDALAQFVPFPQRAIFDGNARLLFSGATGVPTFHGVVANGKFTSEHPDVMRAFLQAQRDTQQYLYEHPLEAALMVAKATGLPPEVVYLYDGPNGMVTFDMSIKSTLVEAMKSGLPFLKELGALKDLDVDAFVDEGPLEQLEGADYARNKAALTNPAAITGEDTICHEKVRDPRLASEAWPRGQETTIPSATPTCLLMLVARGAGYRALYVPDAGTGTRMFATSATWVADPGQPKDRRLLPFGTVADAQDYAGHHPGSKVLDYAQALASVN